MRNPEDNSKNLKEFMQFYDKHENDFVKKNPDKKSKPADHIQSFAYFDNPVTSFHQEHYSTKYKCKSFWTPYLFLSISLILLTLYLFGSLTNAFWFGIITEEKFIVRIISVPIIFTIIGLLSYYLIKLANKWTWKYTSIFLVFGFGVILTIFISITFFEVGTELFLDKFYSILGLAWAPTGFSIFIILKFKPYITDFGGIHLFLGWIYRISESDGDIEALNISFKRLIYELESWLNNVYNLVIKNKYKIMEGFYFNLISYENFLSDINVKHKVLFEKLLQGLNGEDQNIPNLNQFDLLRLTHRLALKEIPKLIKIIETLSAKKFRIIYNSPRIKLKKFKTKFISIAVFIFSSLIPLIISIFQ